MNSDSENPAKVTRIWPYPVWIGLGLIALSIGTLHAVESLGRAFEVTFGMLALGSAGLLLVARPIWRGSFRPGFRAALGLTTAIQLLALPLAPSLSDDVYRYVWEGRVGIAGENPYLHAPTSEHLASLRDDEIWPNINHPDIRAAYPPFLQAALRLGVRIWNSPLGQKLVFGAAHLLAFTLLWRLLNRHGQPPQLALVLGLSPLGAVEFAGMGHSDSLTLAMTLGALAAHRSRRGLLAGTLLACATGTKYLPLALLPFFVRRNGLRPLLSFVATMIALYAPWVPLGNPAEAFAGARAYANLEPTGGSAFPLLSRALEELCLAVWPCSGDVVNHDQIHDKALGTAKLFFAFAGLLLFVRAVRQHISAERFALWLGLFFLVASPTVHPWYVAAYLLPLAAVRRSPLLLLTTGSIVASYHLLPGWLDQGVWQQSTIWSVVAWTPLWIWLVNRATKRWTPVRNAQTRTPASR
ncbi:MAG: glycosyltransferase 87 family protein [Planctomycetota bacterium]